MGLTLAIFHSSGNQLDETIPLNSTVRCWESTSLQSLIKHIGKSSWPVLRLFLREWNDVRTSLSENSCHNSCGPQFTVLWSCCSTLEVSNKSLTFLSKKWTNSSAMCELSVISSPSFFRTTLSVELLVPNTFLIVLQKLCVPCDLIFALNTRFL